MAFSVSLALDRRVENKGGSYKIMLQVIVNRKMTSIATEYAIPEKEWDAKNRKIRNTSTVAGNIARVNNILNKQRADIMDKITALHDEGMLDKLDMKDIRARLVAKSNSVTVFQMYDKIITELKSTGNIGNARAYKSSLQSLKVFTKEKDFPFAQLNFAWLKKYEQFYFSKDGNSVNGFAVYLRAVRAVYNRAIKEGIAKPEDYPFKHYKITKEPTQKRSLKAEQIDAIRALDTGKGQRLTLAKDVFLTSFYLVGISYMDVAHLKVSDLHDGRIAYKRKKTKQIINIKVTPQLQEILDKYLVGKKSTDFIFPIIKSDTPELIYRDVKNAMKIYNKMLKKIAERCEIDEKLTSYWSRHSWATIAKRKGVSTAVISESLGHTTENTTQIYLDSFEDEIIDAANALVTG
jgi:site-specific recombinase XerD